jgi:hypothetical protein
MSVLNCEVIVKFYENMSESSPNRIISRTLGKTGVLDKFNQDPNLTPRPNEFWRVRIVRELQPGIVRGLFILRPIARVSAEDVVKIIPGMYTEHYEDGIVELVLNSNLRGQGISWIVPLDHRKMLQERYPDSCAIICPLL